MTLAYTGDAFLYDALSDSFALRFDFDPARHRVRITKGCSLPRDSVPDASWNDPDDPIMTQISDMKGGPVCAGHLYVADRFHLQGPLGESVHVDVLEIDHDVVGFLTDAPMLPGVSYPSSSSRDRTDDRGMLHVPGFGPGTMISTLDGDLPVEWLAPGDQVLTFGQGPQPLRWIGRTRVTAPLMAADPGLRPVQIETGQLWQWPVDDPLILSPCTGVLLSGAEVELHFGVDNALARVGQLTQAAPACTAAAGITYFTLLFDAHQIVRANGVWCESLFAAASDLDTLAPSGPRPPRGIRHDRTAHMVLRDWEVVLWQHLNQPEAPRRRTLAA